MASVSRRCNWNSVTMRSLSIHGDVAELFSTHVQEQKEKAAGTTLRQYTKQHELIQSSSDGPTNCKDSVPRALKTNPTFPPNLPPSRYSDLLESGPILQEPRALPLPAAGEVLLLREPALQDPRYQEVQKPLKVSVALLKKGWTLAWVSSTQREGHR